MIRIPYAIETEKLTIIAEQQTLGHIMVAEENLIDGNFLVFETPDDQMEDEVLRKIGKALFLHENRIRTLEGKAPITKEQFIAAMKTL